MHTKTDNVCHLQGSSVGNFCISPQLLGLDPEQYDSIMPLTSMQRDLYMDSIVRPDTLQNSLGYAVELHCELDIKLWLRCLQEFADSQSILRIEVKKNKCNETPYQCVRSFLPVSYEFIDLSSSAIDKNDVIEISREKIFRKYDVKNDELINHYLIKLGDSHFITILATHHIIMDGIGFAAHLTSVCSNYEALVSNNQPIFNPDLFPSYVNFDVTTFDTDSVIAFWSEMVKYVEPLDFYVDEEDVKDKGRQIAKELQIESKHWKLIQKFCRANRITPAIYFKCLYGVLLKDYCRASNDYYIVEMSAGRPKGHTNSIGCYFQQTPFVFPVELISNDKSLSELFEYARDYQRSLKENKSISISKQHQLLPHGRIGFMYNFIHFFPELSFMGREEKINQYMNDIEGQVQFVPKVINSNLHLHLYYHEGDFVDYDFLQRIEFLSKQIISGCKSIGDLSLSFESEIEKQVLWNDTGLDRGSDSVIIDFFERQVEQTPNATALVYEDQTLSYSELNARANQFANYLVSKGFPNGSRVGVYSLRSFDMVAVLYGILKAGATYVPLDPEYPEERIKYMLEDAELDLIFSQQTLCQVISKYSSNVICIENNQDIASCKKSNLNLPISGDDWFNIIYTSGSTGKPKGVIVPHKGITNRILWMQEQYNLQASDVVLQKTPFSFDVSVWEFFWPLITGASLVIAKPGGHKDPEYLSDLIEKHSVSIVHFVPSMLDVFLHADHVADKTGSLKKVFCSGEALSFEHQTHFFKKINAELHNLYGPTEASVDVSFWQCQPEHNIFNIPIGKPISNTQLYVLDDALKNVPIGVVGELYIGGEGLACGYLNKPKLTVEKFVNNPFDLTGTTKLYKTGDLARFMDDGNIQYMGRSDFQVKIRGFRIELAEIESVMRHCDDIEDVAVIASSDGANKKLIAFVKGKARKNNQQLYREYLRQRLPDYMIPASFVFIDEMPISSNGKLDRSALKIQANSVIEKACIKRPESQIGVTLLSLWESTLKVSGISSCDNFFELGGHSLTAIKMVSLIKKNLAVDVPLDVFFKFKDLQEMVTFVELAKRSANEIPVNSINRVEVEI